MFDVASFKRIVYAGVLAGAIAGLLFTVAQAIQVSPIILQAEAYEGAPVVSGSHDANGIRQDVESADWKPANGFERTMISAAVNVNLGIAYALLLAAGLALQRKFSGWRTGLLWGLAGYTVFFVAPSIGLPPAIPGIEAAPLASRQLWWLVTVISTASGLALLVFACAWQIKLAGAVLLGVPHLVGAPQAEINANGTPALADLAYGFVYATAIANAVFWLSLGAFTGWLYKRLG